jgi:hypothetical protein
MPLKRLNYNDFSTTGERPGTTISGGAAGGAPAIPLEPPIDYVRAPRPGAWWGA